MVSTVTKKESEMYSSQPIYHNVCTNLLSYRDIEWAFGFRWASSWEREGRAQHKAPSRDWGGPSELLGVNLVCHFLKRAISQFKKKQTNKQN